MKRFSFRTTAIATLATLVIGANLAAAPAEAHGFHGGFGWGFAGFGAAAIAASAAAAAAQPTCVYRSHEWIDGYGREHIRTRRYCY